jgi:hypothetical protein
VDDDGQAKVQWEMITYDVEGDVFVSTPWETSLDNEQSTYSHVLTADATGDGRDDILARIADNGSWVMAEARVSDTGEERFQTKGWSGVFPDEPLLDVMVGDVDADGDEDLIARTSRERWWVKIAEDDSASNKFFGTWSTKNGFVDVRTGDFNGDGLADVAGRDRVDGKWTVGLSTGDEFAFEAFGAWDKTEAWSDVMVGDFNWFGVAEPPPVADGGDDGDGQGGDGHGGHGGDEDATPGADLQRLTPGSGDYDGDELTEYISELHLFSINDIVGGFDGSSYADDPTIIDTAGTSSVESFISKDGNTLYPIDSTFGFYLADFVGAEQKVRDDDYAEGWAGDMYDVAGNAIGLELSDAETGVFKSGLPLGTWLTGLGGVTVKASTEHYVVMADILGFDSLPEDHVFTQIDLIYNAADGTYSEDTYHGEEYTASKLIAAFDDPTDTRFEANESSVIQDIFVASYEGTPIYSVTFKDDGKLLYRWGTAVKRPNDIRMNVSLPVPEEWGDEELGLTYEVTTANLRVNHKITNNPNDQIRPEDLENELAKGRKPSYVVVVHPEVPGQFQWISLFDDYAGDGTWYPAGTVFRDSTLADPDAISSDLRGGFTNAWYTTMDRDPFEPNEQYTPDVFDTANDGTQDYLVLNVPGPRWRLQAGKFGQNLPGVDIPKIQYSRPPFTKENIKYEVGEDTTTVINLLDGAGQLDNGVDLRTSEHWVGLVKDADGNIVDERLATDASDNYITRVDGDSVSYLTVNGAWLSEDFDFSVYIKGDRKPTALYDAQLVLEYAIKVGFDANSEGELVADIGEVDGVTYSWSIDGVVQPEATGYVFDLESDVEGPGDYQVELVVQDSYGNPGSHAESITVGEASPVIESYTSAIVAASALADVNADGDVTANDALNVLNFLAVTEDVDAGSSSEAKRHDVNQDEIVSVSDAPVIVNELGSQILTASTDSIPSTGDALTAVVEEVESELLYQPSAEKLISVRIAEADEDEDDLSALDQALADLELGSVF